MTFPVVCRVLSVFAVGLFLAAGSCVNAGEPEQVHDLLGEKALKVLSAPDRVEVFRVDHLWSKEKHAERFAGYPLLNKGKDQGKEFAAKLGDVLRNHHSYEWNIKKACEFDPGVGYRVWSGKESVVILICFNCDELAVIGDEAQPEKYHIGEIDPSRAALLKLAKEALPDDKAIQGLHD